MLKGGLMIRLIDVVFILLFGFISISEIGPQHSIEPPKSTEQQLKNDKKKKVLFLGITKNGTFIIESADGTILRYNDISKVKSFLENLTILQGENKQKITVHICSNWDAPIRFAMDVADICDNNNIKKSLIVRKVEKPI